MSTIVLHVLGYKGHKRSATSLPSFIEYSCGLFSHINLFLKNHLLRQSNQSALLCLSENCKKTAKNSDAYNDCLKWFSRLTDNKIKEFE